MTESAATQDPLEFRVVLPPVRGTPQSWDSETGPRLRLGFCCAADSVMRPGKGRLSGVLGASYDAGAIWGFDMLLALLSDTHDNAAGARAALELLAPHRPDVYLHAGDLVSPEMLSLFAGLEFHFVFGNNEYDLAALRSFAVALDLHCHEYSAVLELGGKRIGLLHGHQGSVMGKMLKGGSERVDYIVHGHTHERRDERDGAGIRIINPGALHRARSKSVALLDIEKDEVRFLELR